MTAPSVGAAAQRRGAAEPEPEQGRQDQEVVERRSRWLLVGTLLALLAVYVPLLGPSLIGQQVFVETGLVLRFEPWSLDADPADQAGVTVAHDTVDVVLPSFHVWRERLLSGDVPLWSPYVAGGAPLAAVSEHALLSPLSLPYALLPLSLAPAWVRLLEVLAAVGFMALFLRRLGLSSGPSLLGGLIYSCTAFLVLWNNWPQAQVAALIPALFWSVERAMQVRRPGSVVPVALVVASMLLASFPAVLVYSLYLLGPYVLVRTLGRRVRPAAVLRSWAMSGAGLLLGVALAALQLLPFLHHLSTLDLGYREQVPSAHLPFTALATLAVPYALGSESDDTFFGLSTTNVVELVTYVGVVCLVLSLVAVSLRQRLPLPRGVVVLFAGTVVTLALVAFSSDRALQTAQALPFIGSSYIGRTRAVLCFALAVLAAVGAERLVRWRRGSGAVTPWALLPVLAAGGAAAYALRGVLAAAAAADRLDVLLRNSVLPAVVLVLALLALGVAVRPGRAGRTALLVLPVLVAVEGFAFIAPRWPSEDPDQLYPRTGVHEFLEANLQGERFAAADSVLLPGSNAYYGLRAVSGHVFHSPTWKAAVARVDPAVPQLPTLSFVSGSGTSASSPVLDRLSARYFVGSISAAVLGRQQPPGAPTGTAVLRPGDELSVDLAPGPRRALALILTAPPEAGTTGRLHVTFRDGAGQVVGEVTRPGLSASQPAGLVHVPVLGETGPMTRAVEGTLSVEGLTLRLGTGPEGQVAVGEVLPDDDGLRVVLVDESVVYERTRALPRVRFATSAVPVQDAPAAVEALASGRLADDQVVLDADDAGRAAAGAPAPTPADAQVDVTEDSGDVLRVTSDADADGWLVVADAMQDGWRAEVDGAPVPLVPADAAGVAVALPAGEHHVVLRYVPPGLRPGLLVSGATALALLGLAVVGRRYRGRRPGTGTAGPLAGHDPDGREHQ